MSVRAPTDQTSSGSDHRLKPARRPDRLQSHDWYPSLRDNHRLTCDLDLAKDSETMSAEITSGNCLSFLSTFRRNKTAKLLSDYLFIDIFIPFDTASTPFLKEGVFQENQDDTILRQDFRSTQIIDRSLNASVTSADSLPFIEK
jgi:hypothetical protein